MLSVDRVSKRFDSGLVALGGATLSVAQGEIVAIVGTSGCGKSTLLRLIGGLDHPTEGEVRIGGRVVDGPHPDVGFVFQEPRLMPWLELKDNVTFGLSGDRNARTARAQTLLEEVGLGEFASALPQALSGGMAQRAAIARALATEPAVLLLDEPFSALDAFTRAALQDHLLAVWERHRPTMVLVTHDIEEALALADRVVVMRGRPGRINREITLCDPRPRKRSSPRFQALKDEILDALNLVPA
jgi:sulfonate transport system ATP-binding protein